MIDTKKIRIFKAFTLAEVMITMIIVALVTVFSVPVVKKSRLVMDSSNADRHSWGAFYEGDQLVVCQDGDCTPGGGGDGSGDGDGDEVDFTPPAGVNRFNVTVVGGGGGGAAGFSSPENTKKFFADTTTSSFMYKVPNDGVYNIVAIGAGGGGAGGSVTCHGNDGESGGAVVVNANLKRGSEYAVIVGQGGYQGVGKTWGDLAKKWLPTILALAAAVVCAIYLGPLVAPALAKGLGALGISLSSTAVTVTGSTANYFAMTAAGEVITLGVDMGWEIVTTSFAPLIGKLVGGLVGGVTSDVLFSLASNMLNSPGDPAVGGGHGTNTAITGGPNGGEEIDLDIIAKGGKGGKYRIEKVFGCGNKKMSYDEENPDKNSDIEKIFYLNHYDFPPSSVEAAQGVLISKHIVDQNSNRFLCRDEKGNWTGDSAHKSFCQNHLNNAIEGGYNKAITYGNGGYRGKKERKGGAGSGGYAQFTEVTAYGGGAGQAGSVSVYTFDRSPLNQGESTVNVKIGKGGKGGRVAATSARFQNGQDGGLSRFGTKIFAQGGEGGLAKAVGPTSSDQNNFKGIGEDGYQISLPSTLFENAGLSGKFNRDVFKATQDAVGEGSNTSGLTGTPGIGGAGGSAYSVLNTYSHAAYDGGDGASGIVLVTW